MERRRWDGEGGGGGGGGGGQKQWCSQRISWVYILWCIMGSDALREYLGCIFFGASWAVIFFGKNSPKQSTFFLREYFVANFLFLKAIHQ